MSHQQGEMTFQEFNERVMTTKHSVWFDALHIQKRKRLYREWGYFSNDLIGKNKKPSLRKFIYNIRNNRQYYTVPKQALRKNILDKIL